MTFTEFDNLIQGYIDRAEPDMIDFDVFQALVDESNQPPVEIVLTGVIKENTLELHVTQPANAPLRVQGNEILLHNFRLVIQLPAPATAV